MKIATAKQMRRMDEITINQHRVESTILMEKAGSVVFDFIINTIKNIKDKNVLVIAGAGNNGGDALVLARLLARHDISVNVFIIGSEEKLSKDCNINYNFLLKTGVKAEFLQDDRTLRLFFEALEKSDIIADGIFGTGLDKPVKGPHLKVIDAVNKSGKTVVSIDIPSGICSDTGNILGGAPHHTVQGAAVKADYTVTFGLAKLGHFLSDGARRRGKLIIKNIGFGSDLLEDGSIKNNLIDAAMAGPLIPVRAVDAHKGSCGKVLVIGGSAGYTGAPILAAVAALRCGAGLAGICVPEELNAIFEGHTREVITHPVKSKEGHFAYQSFDAIKDTAKNYDLIVLGPGMGRSKDSVKLTGRIIKEINLPKVVDADALFALSALKGAQSKSPWVLTPHPLEFARIANKKVEQINEDLLGYIKKTSKIFKSVVVYKRHNTVISAGDEIYINGSGNAALATAGSGDVLSGMIGGFAAQGLPLDNASILAVFLHGLCADEYIKENDILSMLAGDIIELLPKVIKKAREKTEDRSQKTEFNVEFLPAVGG